MNNFLNALRGLGTLRLALMGATAAVLIGAVLGLSFFAGGPAPVVLYSNLQLTDSAASVSVLSAGHIPYSLADGGATIMVPASSLNNARLALAAKNLPKGGSSSYALFDTSSALTDSDFLDQINQTRALNGELEQTIEQMQGIAEARVNIVLPHREPFAQNPDPAQASVLLTLSGPAILDQGSVNAILNLVASAVPGLKPANISIADSRGDLLAEPGVQSGPMAQNANTTNLEKMTGLQMSQAVEAMLDQALGPGHAHVVATVSMNFDNVDQTQTTYDPNGQVALSQQNSTSKSTTSQAAPPVSVQNNLPNPPPQANSTPTTTTSQQAQTTNFDVSQTVKHLVQNAPQISQISVAVLLDGISTLDAKGKTEWAPRNPAQLAAISNLVKGAVGFQAKRGDVVDVETMQFFADSGAAAVKPASFLQRAMNSSDTMFLIKLLVVGGVTLIALMAFAKPVMMKIAGGPQLPSTDGVRMLEQQRAKVLAANTAALTDDSQNAEMPSPIPLNMSSINSPASQIAALVKNNPRESIATIRSWLSQEQGA